jgi:hypothetical protein
MEHPYGARTRTGTARRIIVSHARTAGRANTARRRPNKIGVATLPRLRPLPGPARSGAFKPWDPDDQSRALAPPVELIGDRLPPLPLG